MRYCKKTSQIYDKKKKTYLVFVLVLHIYKFKQIVGAVFEKIETENLSHYKSYKAHELPVLHNLRFSPPTEQKRQFGKVHNAYHRKMHDVVRPNRVTSSRQAL